MRLSLLLSISILLALGRHSPTTGENVSSRASLEPCATLCLKVIDRRLMQPITSFTVLLVRESPDQFPSQFEFPPGFPTLPGEVIESFSFSGSDGIFRFPELPDRRLAIVVLAPGHLPASVGEMGAGKLTTVPLDRAFQLRGRVTDDQGDPVEGAEIRFLPSMPEGEAGPPRARTNRAGEFTLAPLFRKRFPSVITHPAFSPLRTMLVASTEGEKHELNLGSRSPSGPLAGSVIAAESLASSIFIEAICDGHQMQRTAPDAGGGFSFAEMPYGQCVVATYVLPGDRLRIPPHEWKRLAAASMLEIEHHRPRNDLTLTAPPSATLSVNLSPAGMDTGRCRLTAWGHAGRRETDMQYGGTLRLRLLAGSWTLQATCEKDGTLLQTEPVTLIALEQADLSTTLPMIESGKLEILINGKPPGRIALDPIDPAIQTRLTTHGRQQSVGGLTPGDYEFVVDGRFTSRVTLPATIRKEIGTRDLTIRLDSSRNIEYLDARFTHAAPWGEFRYIETPRLYSRSDGTWIATALLEGDYEAVLSAPGYEPRTISVTLREDQDLTVSLIPLELPGASPEEDLAATERRILETVFGDLHDRLSKALHESDEPTAMNILAQTEPRVDVDHVEWIVDDEPIDLPGLLRDYSVQSRLPSVRIASLARSAGFEPVDLEELPIERSRLGSELTLLQLFDGTGFAEDGRLHVLLSATRPLVHVDGRRAIVAVTSTVFDAFEWLYLIEIRDDTPIILWVAEPRLGC